ncbi:MAG: ATP-binding protein [Candidatus Babeliales bacterium]|nr:ATP-binding protein [Candidatus Babeliales bacterium]
MNSYLKLSLLALCGFGCIEASQSLQRSSSSGSLSAARPGSPCYEEERSLQEITNLKLEQEIMRLRREKDERLQQRTHSASSSSSSSRAPEQSGEITGLSFSTMSENIANQVLENCPPEVDDLIYRIKNNMFDRYEKNVILSGFSGLGKSTMAEAIAKKSSSANQEVSCLLVNAELVPNEFKSSGEQNLKRIFEVAKEKQPCVVVLDELEALVNKHIDKHSGDKNVILALWRSLDKCHEDRIVLVGTMNLTKDLPVQISSRAKNIKMFLPDKVKRERIINFRIEQEKTKKGVTFADDVTSATLAAVTDSFSARELERLIAQVAFEAHRRTLNKTVTLEICTKKIADILRDPARKEERAKGTWLYDAKKYCRRNAIPIIGTTLTVAGLAAGAYYFIHTKRVADQNQRNFDAQLKQTKEIADQNQRNFVEQLKRTDDGLGMQKEGLTVAKVTLAAGAGSAIGGKCGKGVGIAIGYYCAGPVGAELGEKIGEPIGQGAGAVVGTVVAAPQQVWDGTKWVASKTWDGTKWVGSTTAYYTTDNCIIQ